MTLFVRVSNINWQMKEWNVNQVKCPVCASEKVYSLLDTLHCKRCGNIWKEEKKNRSKYTKHGSETVSRNQRLPRAIPDSTEQRMKQQLEGYLKKSNGKFSILSITSGIGNIQMAMFRRYLKICVKNRTLVEKKDQYGIIWYSRPDWPHHFIFQRGTCVHEHHRIEWCLKRAMQ